jgi:hypothetical protein
MDVAEETDPKEVIITPLPEEPQTDNSTTPVIKVSKRRGRSKKSTPIEGGSEPDRDPPPPPKKKISKAKADHLKNARAALAKKRAERKAILEQHQKEEKARLKAQEQATLLAPLSDRFDSLEKRIDEMYGMFGQIQNKKVEKEKTNRDAGLPNIFGRIS